MKDKDILWDFEEEEEEEEEEDEGEGRDDILSSPRCVNLIIFIIIIICYVQHMISEIFQLQLF